MAATKGKRIAMWAGGVGVAVLLVALLCFGRRILDDLRFRQFLPRFKNLSAEVVLQTDGRDDEVWHSYVHPLNLGFWACFSRSYEPVDGVCRLAREFGRHGAETDLKLLYCGPDVFGPADYREPAGPLFKMASEYSDPARAWVGRALERHAKVLSTLQRIACKEQVLQFLEDPILFERFYRAVLWQRLFFLGPIVEAKILYLAEGFRSGDGEDYWWYARDFLLLAHATGRDDLIRGSDASRLQERFSVWRGWMDSLKADSFDVTVDDQKAIWVFSVHGPSQGGQSGDLKLPPLPVPEAPFPEWKGRKLRRPDYSMVASCPIQHFFLAQDQQGAEHAPTR